MGVESKPELSCYSKDQDQAEFWNLTEQYPSAFHVMCYLLLYGEQYSM